MVTSMKALVTGATGLIGSHLVETLIARGCEVRALVRGRSVAAFLNAPGVEQVEGELRDADSIVRAAAGVDVVFHVAALVGEWGAARDFHEVNVRGTENVIAACEKAGVARLVAVSSSSVHGYRDFNGDNEDAPMKKDGILYSDSKVDAEKMVWAAHEAGRVRAATVRPVMVWGPRDRAFFTKVLRALKSRMFAYVGGGRRIIGLAHVRNVCDVLYRAATMDAAVGQAFLVTDGCKTTMRDIVETLCREFNLPGPLLNLPIPAARAIGAAAEYTARSLSAKKAPLMTRMGMGIMSINMNFDISKSKNVLGYAPEYRFPDALPEYAAWAREQGIL